MKFLVKVIVCLLLVFPSSLFFADHINAANFNITAGDVNGLIAAINTANGNGEADTINLTVGSIYDLTAIDNSTYSPNGLPVITSDITINGNGATIQRDEAAPEFRILFIQSGGQLTLDNVIIRGGNADVSLGGGIRNWFGRLTVNNSTIMLNSGGAGGAVATAGVVTEIINSTISDNTAGQGGGVFSEGSGTVSIIDSTFSRNHANTWGGAISNSGGAVSISGSTIINNTANYNGGGVFNRTGSTAISNSTISSNVADIGGGIHNEETLIVSNTTVFNNTASGGDAVGGGIANYLGSLMVTDSTISKNSAGTGSLSRGGGILTKGRGTVKILRTTVSGNSAEANGGAIFYSSHDGFGTFTISDSVISDNSTMAGSGGGIYAENGATVTITGSIFSHNTVATGRGGAFHIENRSSFFGTATLNNNCIIGNSDIGVHNEASTLLDATNNWWGADNGPSGAGSGSGDSVSTNVAFTPFLTTPPATCAPANQPPTANAGGPYSADEGGSVNLIGSSSDPDGDPLTFVWDLDNNGTFETPGQNVTFSAVGLDGPSSRTVVLQVCDDKNACATSSATVAITNVAPTVGSINAPTDPVAVNTAIFATGSFTDPGVLDTHTALWDWGDGTTSSGIVTESNGSGSMTGNHTYTKAGMYTVDLSVTDKDGASGQSPPFQYLVIYDSTAGFVTGGGNINSPAGAYTPDSTLSGRANFSFPVKYLPGDIAPSGEFHFRFRLANINFSSTNYQWLVVSGTKATFKGIGTNNGSGSFTFLVSIIDGQTTGGGGQDKFRVKITDASSGTVLYDNEPSASEIADPTTSLTAGNIVIH